MAPATPSHPENISDADRVAFDIVTAAKAAGISRATVFAELNAGRLRARKYGRRTVILRADLMAWLNSLPARDARAAA